MASEETPLPASFQELLEETSKACRVRPELVRLLCEGAPVEGLQELLGGNPRFPLRGSFKGLLKGLL